MNTRFAHLWPRADALDGPRARVRLNVGAVVLFGLWSVWRGPDVNEDLYNYHLYNTFAFLHGKLAIDLAPAGFQSYFNPLLDVPYFVLNTVLPAPVVGFLYGALHGLAFCFVFALADRVVPAQPIRRRSLVVAMLSIAGTLTANFLSEVGDSMGDITTALPTLAALLLLLRHWSTLDRTALTSSAVLVIAGVLAGSSAGLKLTNAVYPLAMFVALFVHPSRLAVRMRAAMFYAGGVVVGLASTGGYWMWTMWRTFGNPLFPQFGRLFPNPLVLPVSVMDTRWRPHGGLEALAWPFVLSLDSNRVGEGVIHQVIWAIVYALFLFWAVQRLRARGTSGPVDDERRSTFLLAFVAVGFVIWAALFSIYRYLVPIELLAPLAVFLLLVKLTPDSRLVRRRAAWILGPATAIVLLGGVPDLGHARWKTTAFAAERPALVDPSRTSVLLMGDRPFAWIATQYPPETAFLSVNGTLPTSAYYQETLHRRVDERAGLVLALIDASFDGRAVTTARVNRVVDALGLTRHATGCAAIGWAVRTFHLRATLSDAPNEAGRRCTLAVRAVDRRDIGRENALAAERARVAFAAFGFSMSTRACTPYEARIGDQVTAYQLCEVGRPDGAGSAVDR